MIYTGEMIIDAYSFHEEEYSNPRMKLSREVKAGKYIRLKRDLYVSDKDIPSIALAQAIYGPSYISFDYALSYYGMIPEHPYNISCATFNKRRDKVFKTDICSYYYTDVPAKVFPEDVTCMSIDGYAFNMASMEKALCDKLYKISPVSGMNDLEELLLDDMRLEEDILFTLDTNRIRELSEGYRCKNVSMLSDYLGSEVTI